MLSQMMPASFLGRSQICAAATPVVIRHSRSDQFHPFTSLQKGKILTRLHVVDVVTFDGAGQAEQLNQPAVVHHQRVDVTTSQNLKEKTPTCHCGTYTISYVTHLFVGLCQQPLKQMIYRWQYYNIYCMCVSVYLLHNNKICILLANTFLRSEDMSTAPQNFE